MDTKNLFDAFLKQMNCFEAYYVQCGEGEYETFFENIEPTGWFTCWFTFDRTSEGDDYWLDIESKWLEILKVVK